MERVCRFRRGTQNTADARRAEFRLFRFAVRLPINFRSLDSIRSRDLCNLQPMKAVTPIAQRASAANSRNTFGLNARQSSTLGQAADQLPFPFRYRKC